MTPGAYFRCDAGCNLFCDAACGCPDCPDCAPGEPCDACDGGYGGCRVCGEGDDGEEGEHEEEGEEDEEEVAAADGVDNAAPDGPCDQWLEFVPTTTFGGLRVRSAASFVAPVVGALLRDAVDAAGPVHVVEKAGVFRRLDPAMAGRVTAAPAHQVALVAFDAGSVWIGTVTNSPVPEPLLRQALRP
jgi:hypothetical protein